MPQPPPFPRLVGTAERSRAASTPTTPPRACSPAGRAATATGTPPPSVHAAGVTPLVKPQCRWPPSATPQTPPQSAPPPPKSVTSFAVWGANGLPLLWASRSAAARSSAVCALHGGGSAEEGRGLIPPPPPQRLSIRYYKVTCDILLHTFERRIPLWLSFALERSRQRVIASRFSLRVAFLDVLRIK